MASLKTGVYFHPIFASNYWPIMGSKFSKFPGAMKEILEKENVELIEPKKVDEELLLKVHDPGIVNNLKGKPYEEGALLSVGGCVEAAEKVYQGELRNAFVFNVSAGHHAGRERAWGGTYISCTGPMIVNLKEKLGLKKAVILDTDSHHGDGTRDIFQNDSDTMHVCFCSSQEVDITRTNIDVSVGWNCTDNMYLEFVRKAFISRVRRFEPEIIIHEMGHDTCRGDYGDRGLSKDLFIQLVREVKDLADDVCEGRYIIITMGGARPEISEYVHPPMIKILSQYIK